MVLVKSKIFLATISVLIVVIGALFSLYHIEFGLPHSFYADEPEISEFAIKYTYELKDVVRNNNWYRLIPVSYVYGTFPTYFITLTVMFFSKSLNLLAISFDKTTLFVFIRVVTALVGLSLIPLTGLLAKTQKSKSIYALCTMFLVATNWKLIVHNHYANQDVFLAVLVTASIVCFYSYYKNGKSVPLVGTALLVGLAAGTKITALITLPLYLGLILHKKDLKAFVAFIVIILGAFAVTNPFSVIYHENFLYRVLSMLTKEGGMVFDSVDSDPLKYVWALVDIIGAPTLLIATIGIVQYLKTQKEHRPWGIFLLANLMFYVIFYSLQSRRVDRWLLPIIPITAVFTVTGMSYIVNLLSKKAVAVITILFVCSYLYKPVLLLSQFKRYTPKAQAYLWMQKNVPQLSTKLVYTEEGLDPMNKLDMAKVYKYQVYSSESAELFYPQDPTLYDYVVISSRPLENHSKKEVREKYPEYSKKWDEFLFTLGNDKKFKLVKQVSLSKPNLIPLSDVYIYQRL